MLAPSKGAPATGTSPCAEPAAGTEASWAPTSATSGVDFALRAVKACNSHTKSEYLSSNSSRVTRAWPSSITILSLWQGSITGSISPSSACAPRTSCSLATVETSVSSPMVASRRFDVTLSRGVPQSAIIRSLHRWTQSASKRSAKRTLASIRNCRLSSLETARPQ